MLVQLLEEDRHVLVDALFSDILRYNRVQRVPELVRHCRVDEGKEVLLLLALVVPDGAGDVDDLYQSSLLRSLHEVHELDLNVGVELFLLAVFSLSFGDVLLDITHRVEQDEDPLFSLGVSGDDLEYLYEVVVHLRGHEAVD